MIRRPPRSTQSRSSAASDVYKRQVPVPAAYPPGSVRLSVPASLLSAPASAFPEYVDPAYSETPAWENYGEIQANYPATNELDSTYDGAVSAGYDGGGIDRGEYVFGLPNPADSSAVTVVSCLLYTSDAADDLLCVDLGGRRI